MTFSQQLAKNINEELDIDAIAQKAQFKAFKRQVAREKVAEAK